MKLFWIVFAVCAGLAALSVLAAYICYRMAFYVPPRKPVDPDSVDMPMGDDYEPFREKIANWTKETRLLPHEKVSITSFDGLKLTGKYYEYAPGAPIELMLHGYRGTAERDLSGGVQRCFKLGRSALIVDQRCSGGSDGNVITFGVKEHRDCLAWVDFMVEHFGPQVQIIMCGISMGASTVLMAAGNPLPPNVIGVLADCGFTSAKEIICKVIRQMHLPPKLCYPFVKLGAKLFGHFDLEQRPAVESLKDCKVPVLFFHGEADNFVPCQMSRDNYEACASRKRLVTVPGAAHGLSYPVAPQQYLAAIREFWNIPQSDFVNQPQR